MDEDGWMSVSFVNLLIKILTNSFCFINYPPCSVCHVPLPWYAGIFHCKLLNFL